jgi:hypothetical protein
MKQVVVAAGLVVLAAPAALAQAVEVPEMDGGFALAAAAAVVAVGALIYERLSRP